VLGVTALGDTVKSAIGRVYDGVAAITWSGVHYRSDIGRKAIDRK
jgi:phosphoribosylamine--glycine ligase